MLWPPNLEKNLCSKPLPQNQHERVFAAQDPRRRLLHSSPQLARIRCVFFGQLRADSHNVTHGFGKLLPFELGLFGVPDHASLLQHLRNFGSPHAAAIASYRPKACMLSQNGRQAHAAPQQQFQPAQRHEHVRFLRPGLNALTPPFKQRPQLLQRPNHRLAGSGPDFLAQLRWPQQAPIDGPYHPSYPIAQPITWSRSLCRIRCEELPQAVVAQGPFLF